MISMITESDLKRLYGDISTNERNTREINQ